MTPLHLRHRLHSIALSFIGEPPDVREALEQSEHLCERWRASCLATDALRVEAERECDNLRATFDAERGEWRKLLREMEADGERLSQLISTIRDELAAAVEERDRALDSAREAVAAEALLREQREAWRVDNARLRAALTSLLDTVEAHAFDDGTGSIPEAITAAHAAIDGPPTPRRKRTKEERAEWERAYLASLWAMSPMGIAEAIRRAIVSLGGSGTSRQIAEQVWGRITDRPPDEAEIRNDMRWVQDFARAGYLTVAKGPGGVRVYGLKEGA